MRYFTQKRAKGKYLWAQERGPWHHLCDLEFTAVCVLQCLGQITSPLRTIGLPKVPIIFWNGLRRNWGKRTLLCICISVSCSILHPTRRFPIHPNPIQSSYSLCCYISLRRHFSFSLSHVENICTFSARMFPFDQTQKQEIFSRVT